jgi:SAM-dependent methyltransferase
MVSCLSAVVTMNAALAQPAQKPFEPTVGQDGKDVIWVPTPQALVDKMLDMAKVTAADNLVDLGSGDGRTVITAAKRGATARGIEFNPKMVELSKYTAEQEGVAGKATFENADIFKSDFSKADVVTMFLLTSLNAKLRPTILDMKPGTRVVSNTFEMGGWLPDKVESLREECDFFFCKALLWIVPAKVDGDWTLDVNGVAGKLSLTQQFQTFTGAITNGATVTPVSDGRLVADELTFTAGGVAYSGKVRGDIIEGTTKSGTTWQAKRGS